MHYQNSGRRRVLLYYLCFQLLFIFQQCDSASITKKRTIVENALEIRRFASFVDIGSTVYYQALCLTSETTKIKMQCTNSDRIKILRTVYGYNPGYDVLMRTGTVRLDACVLSVKDCTFDQEYSIDNECTGQNTCYIHIRKSRVMNESALYYKQCPDFNYVQINYQCLPNLPAKDICGVSYSQLSHAYIMSPQGHHTLNAGTLCQCTLQSNNETGQILLRRVDMKMQTPVTSINEEPPNANCQEAYLEILENDKNVERKCGQQREAGSIFGSGANKLQLTFAVLNRPLSTYDHGFWLEVIASPPQENHYIKIVCNQQNRALNRKEIVSLEILQKLKDIHDKLNRLNNTDQTLPQTSQRNKPILKKIQEQTAKFLAKNNRKLLNITQHMHSLTEELSTHEKGGGASQKHFSMKKNKGNEKIKSSIENLEQAINEFFSSKSILNKKLDELKATDQKLIQDSSSSSSSPAPRHRKGKKMKEKVEEEGTEEEIKKTNDGKHRLIDLPALIKYKGSKKQQKEEVSEPSSMEKMDLKKVKPFKNKESNDAFEQDTPSSSSSVNKKILENLDPDSEQEWIMALNSLNKELDKGEQMMNEQSDPDSESTIHHIHRKDDQDDQELENQYMKAFAQKRQPSEQKDKQNQSTTTESTKAEVSTSTVTILSSSLPPFDLNYSETSPIHHYPTHVKKRNTDKQPRMLYNGEEGIPFTQPFTVTKKIFVKTPAEWLKPFLFKLFNTESAPSTQFIHSTTALPWPIKTTTKKDTYKELFSILKHHHTLYQNSDNFVIPGTTLSSTFSSTEKSTEKMTSIATEKVISTTTYLTSTATTVTSTSKVESTTIAESAPAASVPKTTLNIDDYLSCEHNVTRLTVFYSNIDTLTCFNETINGTTNNMKCIDFLLEKKLIFKLSFFYYIRLQPLLINRRKLNCQLKKKSNILKRKKRNDYDYYDYTTNESGIGVSYSAAPFINEEEEKMMSIIEIPRRHNNDDIVLPAKLTTNEEASYACSLRTRKSTNRKRLIWKLYLVLKNQTCIPNSDDEIFNQLVIDGYKNHIQQNKSDISSQQVNQKEIIIFKTTKPIRKRPISTTTSRKQDHQNQKVQQNSLFSMASNKIIIIVLICCTICFVLLANGALYFILKLRRKTSSLSNLSMSMNNRLLQNYMDLSVNSDIAAYNNNNKQSPKDKKNDKKKPTTKVVSTTIIPSISHSVNQQQLIKNSMSSLAAHDYATAPSNTANSGSQSGNGSGSSTSESSECLSKSSKQKNNKATTPSSSGHSVFYNSNNNSSTIMLKTFNNININEKSNLNKSKLINTTMANSDQCIILNKQQSNDNQNRHPSTSGYNSISAVVIGQGSNVLLSESSNTRSGCLEINRVPSDLKRQKRKYSAATVATQADLDRGSIVAERRDFRYRNQELSDVESQILSIEVDLCSADGGAYASVTDWCHNQPHTDYLSEENVNANKEFASVHVNDYVAFKNCLNFQLQAARAAAIAANNQNRHYQNVSDMNEDNNSVNTENNNQNNRDQNTNTELADNILLDELTARATALFNYPIRVSAMAKSNGSRPTQQQQPNRMIFRISSISSSRSSVALRSTKYREEIIKPKKLISNSEGGGGGGGSHQFHQNEQPKEQSASTLISSASTSLVPYGSNNNYNNNFVGNEFRSQQQLRHPFFDLVNPDQEAEAEAEKLRNRMRLNQQDQNNQDPNATESSGFGQKQLEPMVYEAYCVATAAHNNINNQKKRKQQQQRHILRRNSSTVSLSIASSKSLSLSVTSESSESSTVSSSNSEQHQRVTTTTTTTTAQQFPNNLYMYLDSIPYLSTFLQQQEEENKTKIKSSESKLETFNLKSKNEMIKPPIPPPPPHVATEQYGSNANALKSLPIFQKYQKQKRELSLKRGGGGGAIVRTENIKPETETEETSSSFNKCYEINASRLNEQSQRHFIVYENQDNETNPNSIYSQVELTSDEEEVEYDDDDDRIVTTTVNKESVITMMLTEANNDQDEVSESTIDGNDEKKKKRKGGSTKKKKRLNKSNENGNIRATMMQLMGEKFFGGKNHRLVEQTTTTTTEETTVNNDHDLLPRAILNNNSKLNSDELIKYSKNERLKRMLEQERAALDLVKKKNITEHQPQLPQLKSDSKSKLVPGNWYFSKLIEKNKLQNKQLNFFKKKKENPEPEEEECNYNKEEEDVYGLDDLKLGDNSKDVFVDNRHKNNGDNDQDYELNQSTNDDNEDEDDDGATKNVRFSDNVTKNNYPAN